MSKVEVNQISSQCGSTLTIGQSGDTVTLACGATQTGFGRTGTVDWDTTAKTASFTAVSGNGYFVNTTSGAITVTLPATPSAGDIVAFKDYAFTFATNNLTVDGNGSPIGGATGTILPTYSTNGTSKTFIYVDGTKGWLVTNESTDTSQESNIAYVTATGGTVTCCGDYKIHTFTGPGTFTVTCAGNPLGSNTVDYLVIAGGGSGGWSAGCNSGAGGGGAGGFRESSGAASGCYTTSPLGSCVSALPVTAQGYPITVGAGGGATTSPSDNPGAQGSNSIFSTITSSGGGRGGNNNCNTQAAGGSGGGGGATGGPPSGLIGGAGNTPPVSPPQGNNGGNGVSPELGTGGGGAAGAVGGNGAPNANGPGGNGVTTSISASPTTYAGGGGGGGTNGSGGTGNGTGGTGGSGGGGAGGNFPDGSGTSGTTNTGSGGGGKASGGSGGSVGQGGSGIVIIRYKYQN